MATTAFYAGLLCLLYLVLSFRVIFMRREARVEIGFGESKELLRRARVHANFAEYAPFAILLMGLAESLQARWLVLHFAGLTLFAGRLIHAYGLSQTPHIMPLRFSGMVLTFTSLLTGALACLALSLGKGI
ncbi:MAG: hypothetical protein F9K44_10460 [Hyphomicrobiaceae bacterium]|nr:MAG: hypothetical protein F9K44_10460 [Hyphomicrobiaceae bacterium]